MQITSILSLLVAQAFLATASPVEHSTKLARDTPPIAFPLKTGTDEEASALSIDDLQKAQSQLAQLCDSRDSKGASGKAAFIKGNKYASATHGGVQVYVCNYSKNAQNCNSQELNYALDQAQKNHGEGVASWGLYDDWAKGYGFTKAGGYICNGEDPGTN